MTGPLYIRLRGLAIVLAILAVLIEENLKVIGLAWALVLLPLVIRVKVVRAYVVFLIFVLGPTAIGLVFVWGYLVGAPPGQPAHSNPHSGLLYALTTWIRLAFLGGIFQLAFQSIAGEALPNVLRCWGFRNSALNIAVGALAVLPEMRLRASQIYEASCARGLVSSSLQDKLRQLPYIIRGLVVWALRASIQRAELWQHRDLLSQVSSRPVKIRGSRADLALSLIAFGWFSVALMSRFQ